MQIFLSWSGARSHKVAELLKEWISCVIQAVKPWLSSSDIDRGALWFSEIGDKLHDCSIGIIWLTRESLNSPWIMFEAGALAKGLAKTKVCTLLIDIRPVDVLDPLAQFNHTLPDKEGTRSLIQTLNGSLADRALTDNVLTKSFDTHWPSFAECFERIISETETATTPRPRDLESIAEEILENTRNIQARLAQLHHPREPHTGQSSEGETIESVEDFYSERVTCRDGASIPATHLYEAYCTWCENMGIFPANLPTFGRALSQIGLQRARIAGRIRVIGIELKPDLGR